MNLSSYDLVYLASTLSVFISQNFSAEDIAILSTFFSAVGDNLAIISTIPDDSNKENHLGN